MIFSLFVILHILSAGIIIGLTTLSLIGAYHRKKFAGTSGELAAIRSQAITIPIMARFGSIGLLVSGVVLTMMAYSFFPFSSLPWLALMQTDFIVILAIAGAVLTPGGKKIHAMAESELSGPNAHTGASDALRALVKRQYAVELLVGALVILAVALGGAK